MKSHVIRIGLLAATTLLTQCAATRDATKNPTRAAFLDEVWVDPGMRGKAVSDTYTKVSFAPVTVGHLLEQGWWKSQNARTRDGLTADARRLADFTRRSMITAARRHPARKIEVVDTPGPGTLIVECSIVELVPAKAFWNSAARTAGFVVPGAGLLGTFGKGSITFEGRLRDAGSGRIIATFRDQSTDKTAVVNLDSYTWYRGSEANIEELAGKTAEFLNASERDVVTSSRPIQLIAF